MDVHKSYEYVCSNARRFSRFNDLPKKIILMTALDGTVGGKSRRRTNRLTLPTTLGEDAGKN